MIFGNEGMPRSGKSLDAMQHIVDSIRHGRCVVTNVNGINYAELAKYLVIPEATLRRMLITIAPPEDMDEEQKVEWVKEQFYANQHPDALWIWDEINQFWPVDRLPLPAKWAKFVTEHGHLGIDVLIMGQDLSELHKTWRGRLQRYTRFTKLDMHGKEDDFHWSTMTNIGRGRYRQTASGKKPYKKEFFPLYKSHRDETTNKGNYKDARFNVFQTKHKVWAGLFGILLICVFGWLWKFFHDPTVVAGDRAKDTGTKPAVHQPVESKPVEVQQVSQSTAATTTTSSNAVKGVPVVGEAVAQEVAKPVDYVDDLAQKYSLRLSGLLERQPKEGDDRPWFDFNVDVVDQSFRVHDRFRRAELIALGWTVERTGYGIKLTKGDAVHVVRAWPIESPTKVSQREVNAVKEYAAPGQATKPALLDNRGTQGGIASLAGTAGQPVYQP